MHGPCASGLLTQAWRHCPSRCQCQRKSLFIEYCIDRGPRRARSGPQEEEEVEEEEEEEKGYSKLTQ